MQRKLTLKKKKRRNRIRKKKWNERNERRKGKKRKRKKNQIKGILNKERKKIRNLATPVAIVRVVVLKVSSTKLGT